MLCRKRVALTVWIRTVIRVPEERNKQGEREAR